MKRLSAIAKGQRNLARDDWKRDKPIREYSNKELSDEMMEGVAYGMGNIAFTERFKRGLNPRKSTLIRRKTFKKEGVKL
jgi:hypothetical protein